MRRQVWIPEGLWSQVKRVALEETQREKKPVSAAAVVRRALDDYLYRRIEKRIAARNAARTGGRR